MSTTRLQASLILTLVGVMLMGIAVYVFLAWLAYIFIGMACLALLLGGIEFKRHHQLKKLPLKAHELEEAKLAHTQEMERERLEMDKEKHALEMQVISGRWQLEQHVTLTRIPADAKGFYPYRVTEEGLQHLPNPHLLNRQAIAEHATTVTPVEEDEEDTITQRIPSLVRYEDVKSLVPQGHTLLGSGAQGIETRPFSVLSTCWIVGGSGTGKSNDVSLKVDEAYSLGCWFVVIDPHRYKEDSLFNSIKGYSKRFVKPGVATTPEEILAVLKAFLREAQSRMQPGNTNRTPIVLVMDEVEHICDTVGLEGDEQKLALETVAYVKKIARMCGQELRGFNMFGWFISQKATGLAWLRKSAMTVIAHKVVMMTERKLACNDDMTVARSMDTWPKGRVLIYGLDFEGYMILQQPIFTPKVVDADPPQAFRQSEPKINSVSEDETASQAEPTNVTPLFRVSVSEDVPSVKIKNSGVSEETKKTIQRMANKGMKMREIAALVGLAGEKYTLFQAVCIELGIKKVEEA